MGTLDDLKKILGDDLGAKPPEERDRSNWVEVCVCGHSALYHPSTQGGLWEAPPPEEVRTRDGGTGTLIRASEGCRGAMRQRGFEEEVQTVNRETRTQTNTLRATCPCRSFRPVVRVDRPNRLFNQRPYPDRHPLSTGIRALLTHLSKRKAAIDNPDWVKAEFDRRFVWIEASQRCSISGCKTTGSDVFPAYVNPDKHSEMRCSKHRDPS